MKRSDYIWVTLFTTLIWVFKILVVTVWIFTYDFVLPTSLCFSILDVLVGFLASIYYFDEKDKFNNTQKIYTFSSIGIILFGIMYSIREVLFWLYYKYLKGRIKTLNNWINNEK